MLLASTEDQHGEVERWPQLQIVERRRQTSTVVAGDRVPFKDPQFALRFIAQVLCQLFGPRRRAGRVCGAFVEITMATALQTFIERKCGVPKRALDNRMPAATVVRARSRRWAVLTLLILMRSAIPAALAFLWCAGSTAIAQEAGFIQGKVTDSSGAPIYGALVIIEGANGSRYTTVTDDMGVFRISSLALGNYSVKISASAFSDWTASNVPASSTPESNHYWRSCR